MPSIEETVLQYGETCPERGEISTTTEAEEVLGQEGEMERIGLREGKKKRPGYGRKKREKQQGLEHIKKQQISQGGEKMEQR
jgi:hypothetical protein